ncbi:VWA domain-containing protein [Deinococcus ruber]|uniref:VWA domain-containing protein n=1 Tax=Deinococcus ruber TaxID=1848197 RepID=A0A918BWB5_9DEIO|nr:VWA domain-containing protein [Deinococcus ruber]GGQ94118.1 VWA domain-containing protein [Deinococcus ruber]
MTASQLDSVSPEERLRRWRLLLGGPTRSGQSADGTGCTLSDQDARLDAALAALYDQAPYGKEGKSKGKRTAGLGSSAPSVAAWLSEVRELFPQDTVRVLQADAVDRLGLRTLLLEPELMEQIEPDIHMAATLMSLKDVMPDTAKETARVVVRKVVDELMRRLAEPLRSAVSGSLNRSQRNNRPRHSEIDWSRTILKNLRHYQPEQRTIVPDRLVGYGRARRSLKDIVLCLDQSGSMASSVVYAGVFGAVLASLPAVSTRVVVFDTEVVDLSEQLSDPVDVLFGVQLGGGTDINRALGYCQGVIQRPEDTILVLISDLYEGGNERQMLGRARALVDAGVRVIALLALDDDGSPGYDHRVAAAYAGMGIPTFACTPAHFPELMATAIAGGDVNAWAASQGIATARAEEEKLTN